jgi:hypothetical protein
MPARLNLQPARALSLLALVGVTGWGLCSLTDCPPVTLCLAAGHEAHGLAVMERDLMMWAAMVAAMLPGLAPAWRAILRDEDWRVGPALAAGYVLVWLGAAAAASLAARSYSVAPAFILWAACLYQVTAWKSRALRALRRSMVECCPRAPGAAWSAGVNAGWHCVGSNLAIMAGLAAIGMSAAVMAAGGAAMAAERVLPESLARRSVAVMLLAAAIACPATPV